MRSILVGLVVPLLLAIGASPSGARGDASGRPLELIEEDAFRAAAQSVSKSVVRIQTVGGADRVGGMLAGSAATTGVVVSEDGFIISSAFNFIAKPSSILIQLDDRQRFPARLIATDRLRMLTLLKIDAPKLTPLPPPRPDARVEVGQWGIAVGRTYDAQWPSLSVGIVSALGRVWGKAIQTDAKVSPVNYGGPLVDVRGGVLGVVVPLSPAGKEEAAGVEWYDSGIGFAIPFADVLDSVARLKAGKDLNPGLLGVTIKEKPGDEHPTIDTVRFESPAEKAGLKPGDSIVELNGRSVRRQDEVKLALGRSYAGDKVAVTVARQKDRIRVEAVLTDSLPPFEPGFLGILPARTAGETGVGIRFVFADSAAGRAGLTAGDRIKSWDGVPVTSADQLASLVRRVRPQKEATLVVFKKTADKTIKVTLGSVSEEIPAELAPTPAVVAPVPPAAAPKPAGAAPAAAAPPVDEKKSAVKPKVGHFRDKLPGEAAPAYWAYVPDSYSTRETWGLVIWIAPARDAFEATLMSRWKSHCDERRLILLAPLPAEAGAFNPSDLVGAKQVVERMLNDYRIDRSRLVVHSFASGAPFGSIFTFDNREMIRGLAIASGLLPGLPPEAHPSYPLKFFFSTSSADGARMLEAVRRMTATLRGMKYPVTLQPATSDDRSYLGDEAVARLVRWIDSLDRI